MATHFDCIKIEIIVFLFAADNQLQLGNDYGLGNISIFLELRLIACKGPRQTADFRATADGEISEIYLCPRKRGGKEKCSEGPNRAARNFAPFHMRPLQR